ncbi:MAG: hypothetical protein LBD99_07095 [Candidatus Margulisbacteria bacterium]|jgi:hypothetical protein|nr:hypothetical protein [Candidatus Margulisiibacteriota bacterium]
MSKKIIIALLLCAGLYALGDKPQDTPDAGSSAPAVSRPPRSAQPPIEELNADQLYIRAYEEHNSAQRMNYRGQNLKAIAALELFQNKYVDDDRKFELMYFLSLDYAKNIQPAERAAVVEKYFTEAPSDNSVYENMRLERLGAYAGMRNTVSASALYTELSEQYATHNLILAGIHRDALPVLESSGDIDGCRKIYSFFRESKNRKYLNLERDYYIYTYKLALLEHNAGNLLAAAPLFKEVADQKNTPVLAMFAESAEYYLQNIEDNRQ